MAYGDIHHVTLVNGWEFLNEDFNYSNEYFELIQLNNKLNMKPTFGFIPELLRGNRDAIRLYELLGRALNIDRGARDIKDIKRKVDELWERQNSAKNKGKRKNTRDREKQIIDEYRRQMKRKQKEYLDAFHRDEVEKVRVTAQEIYDAIGDEIGVGTRTIQNVIKEYKEEKTKKRKFR